MLQEAVTACVDNHMRLVRRILIPWTCVHRLNYYQHVERTTKHQTKPDADRWHFALCRLPFAIIMGHAVNGFRGNRRVTVPYHLCDLRECPCVCVQVCDCLGISSCCHRTATNMMATWQRFASHRITSHGVAHHDKDMNPNTHRNKDINLECVSLSVCLSLWHTLYV